MADTPAVGKETAVPDASKVVIVQVGPGAGGDEIPTEPYPVPVRLNVGVADPALETEKAADAPHENCIAPELPVTTVEGFAVRVAQEVVSTGTNVETAGKVCVKRVVAA